MSASATTKTSKESHIAHGLDNYILLILIFPVAVIIFVGLKLLWSLLFFSPSTTTEDAPPAPRREPVSDECPICMETISFEIMTNCGHVFCAPCFCRHWKRTLYARQITCPMCRGHVQTLIRQYTDVDWEQNDATRSAVDSDVDMFNRWHSGLPVPLFQRIRDLPTLTYSFAQHVISGEATNVLLQSRVLLLGLGVMIYVISPFDLIPEMVAGMFGLIDDLLILLIFGIHIYALYRAAPQR